MYVLVRPELQINAWQHELIEAPADSVTAVSFFVERSNGLVMAQRGMLNAHQNVAATPCTDARLFLVSLLV